MKGTALAALLPVFAPVSAHALTPNDRARVSLRLVGECLAGNEHYAPRSTGIRIFLKLSPETAQGVAAGRSLPTATCLQHIAANNNRFISTIAMKATVLRGAIFRALLSYRVKRQDELGLIESKTIRWQFEEQDPFLPLQKFGECVVKADPKASRDAIFNLVASDAENKAYQSLMPHLAKCVSSGSTIRFSRTTLEGVLAEALYHQAALDDAASTGASPISDVAVAQSGMSINHA